VILQRVLHCILFYECPLKYSNTNQKKTLNVPAQQKKKKKKSHRLIIHGNGNFYVRNDEASTRNNI
jgi:hypothetical protein